MRIRRPFFGSLETEDHVVSTRELVSTLYKVLLRRDAEESEVEGWVAVSIQSGLEAVVEGVQRSEEYERVNKQERAVTEGWSRSQYGEVEILLGFISTAIDPQPTIVEVGAAGVEISNSIDLVATMGWRGLLIEASPSHAEILREAVSGINADVVSCAIDAAEGDAQFFVGMHPHLSSLNKEHAESWGALKGQITVPRRRLANVLAEHEIPSEFTVLSIDIEGLDFAVLNDLIDHSTYRPRWVIIEWGASIPSASMEDQRVSESVRSEYRIVAKTFSNVFLQHISVVCGG